MKVKSISSSWFLGEGRRLDCGPYVSGAVDSRIALQKLKTRKERLDSLTAGHNGGIYNGPQFRRVYVDSTEYGVPFATSGTFVRADLRGLPLLRKLDAYSPKLRYLELKEGMTLIACSGTIGPMTYARPDMDGLWSSQDILKVVPDTTKILPGYLHAFLSSEYGVPLIISRTYGAIIQHLEPEHLADLPVPRFEEGFEREVHLLVTQAAQLRCDATKLLTQVSGRFDQLIEDVPPATVSPRVSIVSSNRIQNRFDAQFHDPIAAAIRKLLQAKKHTTIGDYCTNIFLPGIFKRIHIDDVQFGAPYYTGAALFWLEPQPKGILSRKTKLYHQVLLEKGTVLVQAFGQEGGLTGRSVWVGDYLDGSTTTHMLVRLQTDDLIRAGYLFGFLQSDTAYKQISCLAYGGSIPHFDETGMASVVIPMFNDTEVSEIGQMVVDAMSKRDEACVLMKQARSLVQAKISGAL